MQPSIELKPLSPPWSPAAERAAVIGFWAFLAALEILRRLVDPFRPMTLTVPRALGAVSEYAIWAILTPWIFSLAQRLPLDRTRTTRRVLRHLGMGVGIAVVVEVISFGIIISLINWEGVQPGPSQFRGGPPPSLFRFGAADELLVYFAVLAVGFARNYFIQLRAREQEAIRLQAEAIQLQAQLADARLSALRMQLNPHFLFNTLNAVSSLSDGDPEGVQRIIARLSALLRRTLEGTPRQEVSLAEELSFLRDYFDIQQVRFQDRLQVREEIDPTLLDALVPNLILQPLAENAVEHGVNGLSNVVGHIVLSARHDRETDRLVLQVRDTGPGLPADAEKLALQKGRVGLANTRARLEALYNGDASLELTPSPGGGLVATVSLPYHTAADLLTSTDA